jgi:glycosyltransferase involved in cell wall biosynthesis
LSAPRVSVVIAAYNAASTLAETLASVEAQTFGDLEIVVIDDGSSDATPALLEARARTSSRLLWKRQPNAGVAAAREHAIALARGELIAFVDADDIWLPDKVAAEVALFDRDPAVAFVYCDAIDFFPTHDASRSWFAEKRPARGDVLCELFNGNFALTSTVMVRKAALLAVGGFDRALRVNEDFELWLRLAAEYRFDYVDAILVRRRILESGLTRANPMKCYLQDLAIIDAWVARRPDLFAASSGIVRRRRALILSRVGYQHLADRAFAAARRAYAEAYRLGQRDKATLFRLVAAHVPPLAYAFWSAKSLAKRLTPR